MVVHKINTGLATAFVAAASLFATGETHLTLTTGGVDVVIDKDASPVVRFAASETSDILSLTLGASVPVVTEPIAGKNHIILGTNAWLSSQGIDTASLGRDAFLVAVTNGCVFIAGHDDSKADPLHLLKNPHWGAYRFRRGTLNGVYEFLERAADVRFYFPGELGTCIEPRSSIRLPEGKVVRGPMLPMVRWAEYSDGEWPDGADANRRLHPAKLLNMLRNRIPSVSPYDCCHGLRGFMYVERFGKSHPEYFALDANGNRMIEGSEWSRGHLCFTSGIREEIYRDCLSYCKGESADIRGIPSIAKPGTYGWNYNTTPERIDLMPQDGYAECFCPRCQAAMRPKDRKARMTEIIWGLVAEVAERLEKEGYRPKITMMSYADYADFPDCNLPDTIRLCVAKQGPWMWKEPGMIAADNAYYGDWTQRIGVKPWIWTYPTRVPCTQLNIPDVPGWSPRAWGAYYGAVVRNVSGIFAESETDRAIDNLLGYYILSRICWKNAVNADALIDEFYDRMFGAASPDVKAAMSLVEDLFVDKVAGRQRMTSIGPVACRPSEHQLWTEIYSREATDLLGRLFDAAGGKVLSASLEGRRVALFRRWMYEPVRRRGDAYRVASDVTAWRDWNKAHEAENILAGFKWNSGDGRFDPSEHVSWPASIRHDATSRKTTTHSFGSVALKSGRRYRLSYFVKTNDIQPVSRGGGVGPLIMAKGWSREFPETRNFLAGTVPWIRQVFEFTTPSDLSPEACPLYLRIRYATGTAWFDDVRIDEVP